MQSANGSVANGHHRKSPGQRVNDNLTPHIHTKLCSAYPFVEVAQALGGDQHTFWNYYTCLFLLMAKRVLVINYS